MLLIGGYGGFLQGTSLYDGYHTFNDVWESYDGKKWNLLTNNALFSPRAWFGASTLSLKSNKKLDPSDTRPNSPPRVYLFGGGSIGFTTKSSRRVTVMEGRIDAYYSENGRDWVKISYDEGGSSSTVTQYSSQVIIFIYLFMYLFFFSLHH